MCFVYTVYENILLLIFVGVVCSSRWPVVEDWVTVGSQSCLVSFILLGTVQRIQHTLIKGHLHSDGLFYTY